VLYDMSYINLLLYNSVLPSYKSKDKDDGDNVLKADDPKNRDYVHNIMFE